jgi:mRNA interferase HigB
VDFVGAGRAIFDVGGSKYRIVADVRYELGRVFIVKVMTHAEYDHTDVARL